MSTRVPLGFVYFILSLFIYLFFGGILRSRGGARVRLGVGGREAGEGG